MANVRDFGASGDGVSDDTAAIMHAVKDGDGTLEFPRGEYRISRPIVIQLSADSRSAITGDGTARIIMSAAGPAFHLLGTHEGTASPASFKPGIWKHERMPQVVGIEIVGEHEQADGVHVEGAVQATFSRVLLRKLRHGIHVTKRARNLLIDACHIYENKGIGVFLDQVNLHQAIISSSHISYCRLGGIRIENSEIRNLQITGNDIEYNNNKTHAVPDADDVPTAEIYVDAGTRSIREGTICSNTIQATASPNGANIRMIGDGDRGDHLTGMFTITGNLIGSQTNNIHLSWCRGVTITGNYIYSGHHRNVLAENCRNILLSANCFGHNPDYRDMELATGVRFDNCQSCNITGDLIEDAQAGMHTVTGVDPVPRDGLLEIVNCQRMNITGTQILDAAAYGLFVRDSSDVLVNGCTIIDDRKKKLMKSAISWQGDGSGNIVAACRLGEGTEPQSLPGHVNQT